MDRRYSPVNEIPSSSLSNEPHGFWRRFFLLILLVIAGLFTYNSLRIVMRLRSDPPPAVVGARLSSDDAAYQSQKRMAQACWNYALVTVQQEYPFGQSLPKYPPRGISGPSAISIACWPGLRNVWTRSDSWVRKYEWDTSWLTNPNGSFQLTLHRVINFFNVSN